MENYHAVITRLAQQLADIDANIHKPLVETANSYRIAAESVCKAVLVGNTTLPTGNLEKLIADASKQIDAKESARDASIFKSEIKYLQNVGNAYSHDGAASSHVNNEDQLATYNALIKVLRVVFFSESDLDAPLLPKGMENRFPTRLVGRTKFENPRSEEVIRLCFPKQVVSTKISRAEHTTRIVYDYVVADLGGGLSKGMLFLRSRTAIENSISDFFDSIGSNIPNGLDIITPRAYRPDGPEIDRKKSIQDIMKQFAPKLKGRNLQVVYFDDFVWESCLPPNCKAGGASIKKASHFITQTLDSVSDIASAPSNPMMASDYFAKILQSAHDHNPVQIVIGPAGIGKTTFCDDLAIFINGMERKRVILLSATDFREISNTVPIESVSDLYRVAVANGLMDEESSIESHNFEINLACGNFVLLIDGFDELESHLGDSLNFDKFMSSLSDLEECFRRVLVVLTVRDYDVDRFKQFRQTSICRLKGFSEEDTDRYLKERLVSPHRITNAKSLLAAFNEEGDRYTTIPLYASLICDYLVEDERDAGAKEGLASDTAKFFASNKPLDLLVRKIVDREIAKQSLGKIHPDDFFDILIEIIRAPQLTITKGALLEYVSSCGGDPETITANNFLRNPFLRWEKETISFRYDSLTYFFKSRLLARKIQEGQFSATPSIEFLAEFCRGEGPLYEEIKSVLPAAKYAKSTQANDWFHELIKYGQRETESKLPWRKAVSAFLYWALESDDDKKERSATISSYFGGDIWAGLSIYGRFYPLNLCDITVRDGLIENYTSLITCDSIPGKQVFFSTSVDFDESSQPEKLDRSLFANDCKFSSSLKTSFQAREMADQAGYEVVRDNIYKILKVGFRSNRFSWKSKDVYKNVTVVGRFSLESYIDSLIKQGVLISESGRGSSSIGYVVTEGWHSDARKLVEEKNLSQRMAGIISSLPQFNN